MAGLFAIHWTMAYVTCSHFALPFNVICPQSRSILFINLQVYQNHMGITMGQDSSMLTHEKWRRIGFAVLISWLVSLLGVVSTSMAGTGWSSASASLLVLLSFAFTPLVAALAYGVRFLLQRVVEHDDAFPHALDALIVRPGVRSVLFHGAAIFALWSFWIVAFYPGSMFYDTFYQISQSYPMDSPVNFGVWYVPNVPVDAHFSDHHPIFDTLIYGLFAQVSDHLTGSWNLGLFVLSCIQAFATAIVLSYGLAVAREFGAPRFICAAAYLFFGLVPIFGHYASLNMKDSLFSPVYIWWFVLFARVVRTKGEALELRGFFISILCAGILTCLTKKTGVYIVGLSFVFLAVVYRRASMRCVLQAACVFAVMFVFLPRIVFPVLDVVPGGKQEILGTVFQQTARYVAVYGDQVTSAQRDAIDAVLNYDSLAERYNPRWADPVKYDFVHDAAEAEWREYARVWAEQGLTHPWTYVEATIAPIIGFLSPTGMAQARVGVWDSDHGGSDLVWQPASLDGIRDLATRIFNGVASIPFVNVAMMVALYATWIPAFCFWASLSDYPRWLALYIPVVLTMATVFLSPMFDTRYALSLIYSAPLLVCFVGAGASERRRAAELDEVDEPPASSGAHFSDVRS